MEIELNGVDFNASVWDVKRAVGEILHGDDFFLPSDPKARRINFQVKLQPGHGGVQNNGRGTLIVPRIKYGEKLMHLVYGQQKPDYQTTQTLDKTPYLEPEIEEVREDKMNKLDVGLHVDKVQFGVFFRRPQDDPMTASRRFSNEYELSHQHKGAGLLSIEYDHKLIRVRLGDPMTEEVAYNIAITFANIHKLAIGIDFGNPFICFDLLTPPVFQRELFNRTLTGDEKQDSKKYRKRIDSINPGHAVVAPYAHQIRFVLHEKSDIDEFEKLCFTAGIKRPWRGTIEADSMGFFRPKQLFKVEEWLRRCEWSVAFQIEALLRNGLVNTDELLDTLQEPIQQLCRDHPDTAAETLRYFTLALRTSDALTTPLACLKSISSGDSVHAPMKLMSGTFLCHHVTVTPSRLLLEGPYAIQSNRVIRKYAQFQDNFIRVDFRDEDHLQYRWDREVDGMTLLQERVGGILKNGINIAGRHFEFLAYSNSALREHAVWFVHPFPNLTRPLTNSNAIRAGLGDFSGVIKFPSKYAARIAQAFTATDPSVSIRRDQWDEMPDMGKDPYLFTDGVGTISKELGNKIWNALCADRDESYRNEVQPSAYQIRFLGFKGMVAVDPQLEGIRMRLRPSMNKFKGPEEDEADIEIARAFEKPGKPYLNRPLIMILEDRGVEKKHFLKLQDIAIADIHMSSDTLEQARDLFGSHSLGTSYRLPWILQCLDFIGKDLNKTQASALLGDPFITRLIDFAKDHVLRDIKHAARIPIPESYHLVGVADEGPAYVADGHEDVFCLEDGQIFVCIQKPDEEPKYIQGPVAITRSPTVHPGDVQRVYAIGEPPKGKLCLFRDLKNVVVLPSVGDRSLASCLGGGDLDGDLYAIIKEGTLLPTEHIAPAKYISAGTRKLDRDGDSTIDDICDFVVEYINSDMLGLLSDSHLVIADQSKDGTHDKKCLKLAELCSQAVDYPKNGIPVDMQNSPRRLIPYKPDWKRGDETVTRDTDYYESTRALGDLYRNVKLMSPPEPFAKIIKESKGSSRPKPLCDPISQALKPMIQRHLRRFFNEDSEVADVTPLFRNYLSELKYIRLTHTLTDSPDTRLEEEEIVVGTILANCSQHRWRTDRIYRMRLHSAVLVGDVQKKLYEAHEEPTIGELEYALSQAWLAWDFGMRNRESFGANSFALIALGVLCNVLQRFGELNMMKASKKKSKGKN